MSKDLTISNIERQNVLNNRLAVDAIIAKIEMPGMFFENEFRFTKSMVAEFYNVDISTIHNWCKSKRLNPLGLGSRVYFLRSEVEASLKPLNV